MTREVLGEIEHLVLLAVFRLGADAYGVPIIKELQSRTKRSVSRAGVYIALKRLEAKGFVRSRLGEKRAERGGRPRRHYTIQRAGVIALKHSRAALMRMWQDVEVQLES